MAAHSKIVCRTKGSKRKIINGQIFESSKSLALFGGRKEPYQVVTEFLIRLRLRCGTRGLESFGQDENLETGFGTDAFASEEDSATKGFAKEKWSKILH